MEYYELPPFEELLPAAFRDRFGIHPAGQNGSDEIERVLNAAGFSTAVSGGVRFGSVLGFEFKYFDTRDELGIYLELLDFWYMGEKQIGIRKPIELFAGLKRKLRGR